jgi:hypothetical protein
MEQPDLCPQSPNYSYSVDPESGSGACGAVYIWNNTIVRSPTEGNISSVFTYQHHSGTNNINILSLQNNHYITDAATPVVTTGVSTLTDDTNITVGISTASGQGYTALNFYSPTSGASPTVATGTNLTASCGGAFVSLCSGTTRAGTVTLNTRPAATAWDVGAYQSWLVPLL